jgi:hypothetical protein
VTHRRLSALLAALTCAGLGAVWPTAGCNGTGATPLCTLPDGADDPEAGCGELVEAATEGDGTADAVEETATGPDAQAPDTGLDSSIDSSDSGTPGVDAADAHDANTADVHDAHVADSKADAKG